MAVTLATLVNINTDSFHMHYLCRQVESSVTRHYKDSPGFCMKNLTQGYFERCCCEKKKNVAQLAK